MRMVGLAVLCAFVACWSPSWAYDEITVANGGSITGTVTMTGGKTDPQRVQSDYLSGPCLLRADFHRDRMENP